MKRIGALAGVMLVLAASVAGCRGGAATERGVGPGVTKAACPAAVNRGNGCIYLGIISDLTVGPFAAATVLLTEAQRRFWDRVNARGGIGGYDIDVTTYVRDNRYNPEIHNQAYQEIKGRVLALAQTQGSPTTAAIINDLRASRIVAVPASATSAWAFEDVIIESGANYCLESMNAIDYAVDTFGARSVLAVHFAGDYGDDAAAGAMLGARARGLRFSHLRTDAGQDRQSAAIASVLAERPDVVILSTGPAEAAAIVGGAAQRGYTGTFIGTSPSWAPGLAQSAAAPALAAQYLRSAFWSGWDSATPGHEALRASLGPGATPHDVYITGWQSSYPLQAALERAAEAGDLTRDGLLAAVRSLSGVDYEGMLPAGSGNYAAGPDGGQVRLTAIYRPDASAPTGVVQVTEFFTGPTAKAYRLTEPCFQLLP